MKVVILGRDGRVWSLAINAKNYGHKVYVLPNSHGIGDHSLFSNDEFMTMENDLPEIATKKMIDDFRLEVITILEKIAPDLIIVTGIEFSYNNIVNYLHKLGYPVFGVDKAGSLLETDRVFGKEFCKDIHPKFNIPEIVEFESPKRALEYIRGLDNNSDFGRDGLVIKTGELFLRKVGICYDLFEAEHFLMWLCDRYGNESTNVFLEDRFIGLEVGAMVVVTKRGIIPWNTTFEYKRLMDGDMGPMTAEMGSVVFAGIPDVFEEIYSALFIKLQEIGYVGVLDINTIITDDGTIGFIEFTTRFGDPTTEIAVPMFDEDFSGIFKKIVLNQEVDDFRVKHPVGVGVVLAIEGYPYEDMCIQNMPILGHELPYIDNTCTVVPMSASYNGSRFMTRGGRQICVSGYGDDVKRARETACGILQNYDFFGKIYRTDIGANNIQNLKLLNDWYNVMRL